MRTSLTLTAVLLFATTALAHEGVTNKAVMTRMETMVEIKDTLQALGKMANGAVTFDADAATAAKATLVAATARITDEFAAQETDPKMQAKPAIWTNWADFEAKANASLVAAEAVQVGSLSELQQSLAPYGETCSACHKAYRVKKK